MTAVNLVTIANSISAITITGVTVKTLAKIPVDGIAECPFFAPRPDNFITGISLTRESFGGSGAEKMNLVYTMHWQYYHAPIGTLLSFQDYADMLENIEVILETLANNDAPSGAIDMLIQDIPTIAQVADAAGNYYHGAVISLKITEFING